VLVLNTTQHKTVQLIFPLILQTIVIAQMLSIGVEERLDEGESGREAMRREK